MHRSLLLLPLLLLIFAGSCEKETHPIATIRLQLSPVLSEDYVIRSLKFNSLRSYDSESQSWSYGTMYTKIDEQNQGTNASADRTLIFDEENQGVTFYTSPGRLRHLDFNFGNAVLQHRDTGEEVRVGTCVPDFVSLPQSIDLQHRKQYDLQLIFDPDNVHVIDDRPYLDVAGSMLVAIEAD